MLIEQPTLQQNGKDVVLTAKINFASGKSTEIFFSVDKRYAAFVKNDASPFLASLLFPAMKLGEDIHIDAPISTRLFANTKKIMDVVAGWNIGLKKINITVKDTKKSKVKSENIGTFFSGGVDSFATYLRNKSNTKKKINYFILIYGFDFFVKDESAFKKVYKSIKTIAKSENVSLVVVKTNLKDITDPILKWGISHGGALSSTALLLSSGFKKIYIPSTYSIDHLFPWGSHPDLDYLWSNENLKITHDSSDLTRQQKVALYISKSPVALKYLRVCWSNYEYNCAGCSKCIRTMLALHVTDSLHKSHTFPKKLELEQIKNLQMTGMSDAAFFQELLSELKKDEADKQIQEALEYAFMKSRNPDMKKRIRGFVSFIDKQFNQERLFWYLAKRGVTRV